MKIIFIIGPYRGDSHHDVHENIHAARTLAKEIWAAGHVAICPHLNTAFFSGVCNENIFLEGYQKLLLRCDGYALVRGWENSSGSVAEVALANANNIPLFEEF